jgi:hypothetical protein
MSIRLVVLFGIALTATLLGSHVLLRGVFSALTASADRRDRPHPPLRADRVFPPEPRLQTAPGEDLEFLRRAEEERLRTYGWIDREKRILRIPIEKAMELVVSRGLPSRTPPSKAD